LIFILLLCICFHPIAYRKTRDELSHNVFLMLQECNKFREHQARETLIELLQKQLEERKRLVRELQAAVSEADELFGGDDKQKENTAD